MNGKCEIEKYQSFTLLQNFWHKANNHDLVMFLVGFSSGSYPLPFDEDIKFLIEIASQKRDDEREL